MQLSWCSILHTLASVDTETRVGVGPAQWVVSQASNWLEEPNKGFSIIKVSMGLYFINIEQLHGLCCDGTMAVLHLHCRGERGRGPRTCLSLPSTISTSRDQTCKSNFCRYLVATAASLLQLLSLSEEYFAGLASLERCWNKLSSLLNFVAIYVL